MKVSISTKRLLSLLFIFALALTVRGLTATFIRAHFNDSSWFQFGSYAVFDSQAQAILDRRESVFWINDSTRTDRIVYPPGYPYWLAFIYKISGQRSPAIIQQVQIVLDSLSVLLLVGIGFSAYRWTVGLLAGILAALSPLLALAGATPNADAPASWLVLAGVWCLLLAAKRQIIAYAIAAGALLGVACWLRVNLLFLFVAWAVALLWFVKTDWRRRVLLSGSLTLATLLVIAPLVIRNLVVFYPEVAPTGLGVGWNLLAGIGETERGAEFGAPCCDEQMIEQDRRALNLPADAQIGLFWPDGIRRDRERGRRAIGIIASHPLWYSGVMARRIGGHFKFAGAPAPHVGSAGINITSQKSLSPGRQGGMVAFVVNVLGDIQSVLRFIILPFMLVGLVIAWRREWRITALIFATIVYYLITLAIGHSEIRYGLPMQALLFVFAAAAFHYLGSFLRGRKQWHAAV